ncbi:hypothetical protein [Fluviicola taffensis]|uniref:hypothetical protein n=1 Tax=Fluviicola taffensis TaxID=191579 RepID=UPI003137F772
MNVKPLLITAAAAVTLLLNSCSGTPGIADVESELKSKIQNESNGNIELTHIEKTNSKDNEILGQKIHTIEYKATITFKKDCDMYVNKSGVGPLFESFETYDEQPEFIPSMMMMVMPFVKGEKTTFYGSMRFQDTENGWVTM